MNKNKKKNKIRFLIVLLFILGILGFLVKDQLKITVVNSFSEAFADSLNFHELKVEEDIKSFSELYTNNKKTFVFVTSNWCSLCDALAVKLKEISQSNPNYIIYEADIDNFRTQLSEYKVTSGPKLILIGDNKFKILENVRFDNLEQILSTEL